MSDKFNWKDLLAVLAAALIGGAGWTQDSQMVVITAVAIGGTWFLGWLAKRFNYKPGKAGMTAALFVVSVVLAVLFNPVPLPLWPAWTSDLAAWAPLFLSYLNAWIVLAAPVVAGATMIYNILLAKVLEKTSLGLNALLNR